MFEFNFRYTDNIHNWECSENAYSAAWASFWDAERTGEITIHSVEGTTDNWETSWTVYEEKEA